MDVTCLVPAFKVRYLPYLLFSLRMQSRAPSRIIISDDTPSRDFFAAFATQKVRAFTAELPIDLIEGPRQGHHRNIAHLLDRFRAAPTSHLHIFNDDDLIYPDFYAHHARIAADRNPLCSISRRWVANEDGFPIRGARQPDGVVDDGRSEIEVTPPMLIASFIEQARNWLGELSCAVFRADAFDRPDRYCVEDGIPYFGLNDIGSFLVASLRGPLIYSTQYLGAFRRSDAGLSRAKGYAFSLSILARFALALIVAGHGQLDGTGLVAALRGVREQFGAFFGDSPVTARLDALIARGPDQDPAALRADFLAFWRWYREDVPDLRSCGTQDDLRARLQGLIVPG